MTIAATQLASINGTQTRPVQFQPVVAVLENVQVLALQYDQTKTSVVENVLVLLENPAKTGTDFGYNSQIYLAHKKNWDLSGGKLKTYAIPLTEPAAASKSAGGIDFTGTVPTEVGTYTFYIHGLRFTVSVLTTDTATTLGEKVATAINASTDVGVTAVNTTGVVAVTCTWGGLSGDDIRIAENWKKTDDPIPAGVTTSITQLTAGAGDESSVLTDAITEFVDDPEWKTELITPSAAAAALTEIDTAFGRPDDGTGSGSGLWADEDYKPATNWVSTIAAYSTAAAITANRKEDPNNNVVCIPDYLDIPFLAAVEASTYAALSANSNPATKLEGKPLSLSGPLLRSNDWTKTNAQRNLALNAGLTVVKLDSSGNPVFGDVVTPYRPDGFANPPFRFEINKRKTWNVAKSVIDDKLVYDNDVIVKSLEEASSQPKATDVDAEKARIVSLSEGWVKFGWIYNGEFTTSNMVVKQSESNPDRIDRAIPILLSGNKRVMSDTILVDRDLTLADADVVVKIG
jgi:phage tail sheath gpL-like